MFNVLSFINIIEILNFFFRLDVSARLLTQAVDYLKLCQPPSSFYLLFGMANLATFYKILLKPDLAIPRFKYVVEHAGKHNKIKYLWKLYRF